MPRPVLISLFVSLCLHLVVLFLADVFWYRKLEAEVFRARLLARPRFVQPPRPAFPRPELPRVEMEYLPSAAVPTEVPETGLSVPSSRPLETGTLSVPLVPTEAVSQPKAEGPELAREEMPSPVGEAFVDTFESQAMELLDLETLARADQKRAVVIPDLRSRRDTRGYVNFTSLRLDGVGSYAFRGKPVLGDLARYMRDYTQILARLRPGPALYFLSEELLKDPIHFLFPMPRHEGSWSPHERFHLNDEEVELLGRYLRGGGFLFVDAGCGPDDRWFLREMVRFLRRALGAEGRLFKIPASNPIYHSFYSFGAGFPGELDMRTLEGPGADWFYPDREPCMKPPRGLWGVEWNGELVGVISDLDLHLRWGGEMTFCDTLEAEEEEETIVQPVIIPYLQAATNVVVYALTRPGGLATWRARPAWEQRRPEPPLETAAVEEFGKLDEEVFDVLEATLALVHAPLGKPIREGGLRVTVDGVYAVEVLQRRIDGLLLHNLPAGRHRIELHHAGKSQRMEVELRGGRVLTVSFKLRGLGFFTVLALDSFVEQVRVEEWLEQFADLVMEEVYWEGKGKWPDGFAP